MARRPLLQPQMTNQKIVKGLPALNESASAPSELRRDTSASAKATARHGGEPK
ncbi:MAG: hypothetical protein WCS70_01150 [Verrucomicrobiota bacterium]